MTLRPTHTRAGRAPADTMTATEFKQWQIGKGRLAVTVRWRSDCPGCYETDTLLPVSELTEDEYHQQTEFIRSYLRERYLSVREDQQVYAGNAEINEDGTETCGWHISMPTT